MKYDPRKTQMYGVLRGGGKSFSAARFSFPESCCEDSIAKINNMALAMAGLRNQKLEADAERENFKNYNFEPKCRNGMSFVGHEYICLDEWSFPSDSPKWNESSSPIDDINRAIKMVKSNNLKRRCFQRNPVITQGLFNQLSKTDYPNLNMFKEKGIDTKNIPVTPKGYDFYRGKSL